MRFAHLQLVMILSMLLAVSPACRTKVSHKLRLSSRRTLRVQQQLSPLAGSKETVKLELPHFDSATVVVPVGTRWSRPVIVAIHGRSDSPELNCEIWRTATENSNFVLCPASRATPHDAAIMSEAEPRDVESLANEIREGLIAIRKRYGRYVARNEVVLAGNDTGAGKVVPIAMQNPTVFSVLWLINGGFQEWASALSTNYAQRGGKLLGLVCSDQACEAETTRVAASARAAGLKTAIIRPGPLGFKLDARIAEALRLAWRDSKPSGSPWSIPGASNARNR